MRGSFRNCSLNAAQLIRCSRRRCTFFFLSSDLLYATFVLNHGADNSIQFKTLRGHVRISSNPGTVNYININLRRTTGIGFSSRYDGSRISFISDDKRFFFTLSVSCRHFGTQRRLGCRFSRPDLGSDQGITSNLIWFVMNRSSQDF